MSNFHCAAPWRGLHINPQGSVKTCCAGDPNMLGNLNEQPIEQILNSERLVEIRNSLARGQAHKYCSNCVKAERLGARSERHWHNDVNSNFDYTTAGTEYHYPVIVDVRWNTTCNLSCNYCGEFCSSKWAAIKKIPFRAETKSYYEQVCDFLEQHQSHIHEVALVGGEPLLLPENERLLDVIPPNALVTLITNLSVDLENNKIFKKLSNRKKVGWSLSFDNIEERFEYVRHGGNWQLLTKNLNTVKQLMINNGHHGGIHSVYNIYNATRICELRQLAQEVGLSVLWQNLFQPDCLNPFLHGPNLAQLATEEIERFYTMNIATPMERDFFNQALDTYRSVARARPDVELKFKNHIEKNESVYHSDTAGKFAQLWPELSNLI